MGLRMASTGWQARLRASPELFPLAIDPVTDRVELRMLPPVEYEKASFLDARLTVPPVLVVPFAELAAAARGLPVACDWIFHVGHVGSTLLSRLLGTHPSVFSLREPAALRTFAQAELEGSPWTRAELFARLDVFLGLYSRTWGAEQRALVKATSLVGELADDLLARAAGARALMMTVRPEVYLATILGGPNSRVELRMAAPARLARLRRRLGERGWALDRLSEGELAAMSWACEMAALTAAATRHPGRAAWIDFDAFLADPRTGLGAALAALGRTAAPGEVERMAGSAYLQRYSKAPEYAYGPQVRDEVLATARREHGDEIRRGLRWIEAAAAAAPALAPVLEVAEVGSGR